MIAPIVLTLLLSTTVVAKTLPATQLEPVKQFINQMVEKHHFDKNELELIFSEVQFNIVDKAKPKKKQEKKVKKKKIMTWNRYKNLFITDQRIKNGINFWKKYLPVLERAEKQYNIPSEVIVAVLGIETNYGNTKGSHPTFNTLTQRAFGNYRRYRFYKKELESFLLMTRENQLSPMSIKGSYAGAMGYPQFISSSYRYYAVDFNADGKIDLFTDPIDSIGSIANYFAKHYWQEKGAFALPIELNSKHQHHAKSATNKPTKSAKYWRNKGLKIHQDIKNNTKVSFISLPQKKINETWLTFWNFYVLTRYNHDNRYAMAVYQLSEQLKQRFSAYQK